MGAMQVTCSAHGAVHGATCRREGGVDAQAPHTHGGLKQVVIALCLHSSQRSVAGACAAPEPNTS